MSTLEQMDDNISYMKDFKPLTEDEEQMVLAARDIINENIAIPCTACCYCIDGDGCPVNIPIPRYFALYNTEKQEIDKPFTPQKEYYDRIVASGDYGRAGDCIECGHCVAICPQHINVIEWMKEVSKEFD